MATARSFRFSDELVLEILEHLIDADLLSLATVSKHFHDLALVAHLARHGITETDIQAKSFDTTIDAVPALRAARFITTIDALRLRIEPRAKFEEDVAPLAGLARRLPIKSLDVEFSSWWFEYANGSARDMMKLLFDLLSYNGSRPAIIVTRLEMGVARTDGPTHITFQQLLRRLRRALRPRTDVPAAETAFEEFRGALHAFSFLPLLEGPSPSLSIPTFDAPAQVGSLVVCWPLGIHTLHLSRDVPALSPAQIHFALTHLNLPVLDNLTHGGDSCAISDSVLRSFVCRHPTLKRLSIRGRPMKAKAAGPPPELLPFDALPLLEYLHGSAHLLAWLLASPQPFAHLHTVIIQLYDNTAAPNDYCTALNGLKWRPTVHTLTLELAGWAPWQAGDFSAPTAPERALLHMSEMNLKFRFPSHLPSITEWLRLFRGLREVSFSDMISYSDPPLLGPLSVQLAQEFPSVSFRQQGYLATFH